jgi:hypothetical protein
MAGCARWLSAGEAELLSPTAYVSLPALTLSCQFAFPPRSLAFCCQDERYALSLTHSPDPLLLSPRAILPLPLAHTAFRLKDEIYALSLTHPPDPSLVSPELLPIGVILQIRSSGSLTTDVARPPSRDCSRRSVKVNPGRLLVQSTG